LLRKTFFRL